MEIGDDVERDWRRSIALEAAIRAWWSADRLRALLNDPDLVIAARAGQVVFDDLATDPVVVIQGGASPSAPAPEVKS